MSIDTAAPQPSPAQAIAAKGTPITLLDGTTVRLRYSMASLAQLEERFGSMVAISNHVEDNVAALNAQNALARGATPTEQLQTLASKGTGAIFTAIADVIVPGLIDAAAVDPRTGQPVWLGEQHDVAMRLLDPSQLGVYIEAFRTSFVEAFGTPEREPASDAVDPLMLTAPLPTTGASPGATGITLHAASPVVPTTTFGG